MKNIAQGAISLLICTLLLLFLPTEADAAIYSDTLRLHVIANSDSDFDQELKLSVRDFLLSSYAERLYADSFSEAQRKAEELLPEMETAVEGKLKEAGVNYDCQITLREETYATRFYESFQMPSGKYLSLRVILGAGEGKNWWCVMYPPMCLSLCTEMVDTGEEFGYTEEELNLISNDDYIVKFKLLEVASDIGDKIRKKN